MTNSNCNYNRKWPVIAVAVFLCLLLLKTTSGSAQSYYTFQLKHPSSSVVYNYFLRMEANGSNILRIAYKTDSTKSYLAELEMVDSITPDNKYFLFPKSAPRFIQSAVDNDILLPHIFFEKRSDSNTVYYEPSTVTLTQNNKPSREAIILSILKKSYDDLVKNKKMVLEYYKMNEPFFAFLSQNNSRNLLPDERKRKLYLIIIANTNDDSIGRSAKKDLVSVTGLFAALTKQTGIGYVPIIISGDAFNIGNTNKVIDTIKPSDKDIVFFYYTGHGFRTSEDKGVDSFPRISFRTNRVQDEIINYLKISDIYKRLSLKNALLTIVISDCCNARIEERSPIGLTLLRPRGDLPGSRKLNYDNFKKLFIPAQKTKVIIGSAAPGQLAVGNPDIGGYFTNAFISQLFQSLYSDNGQNSWLFISRETEKKTLFESKRAVCNITARTVEGRCVQKPTYWMVPR